MKVHITFFPIKLSENKPAYFGLLVLCEGSKSNFIKPVVNQITPKRNALGVMEITVHLLEVKLKR